MLVGKDAAGLRLIVAHIKTTYGIGFFLWLSKKQKVIEFYGDSLNYMYNTYCDLDKRNSGD